MLRQALPRTLNKFPGIRAPILLAQAAGWKDSKRYLRTCHRRPQLAPGCGIPSSTRRCRILTSRRCLSAGLTLNSSKDPTDYANDPLVKEWMKELQQDFDGHVQKDVKEDEEEKVTKGPVEEHEESREEKGGVEEEEEEKKETRGKPHKMWSQYVAEKYQRLESHSQIIYDYDEERQRMEAGLVEEEVEKEKVKLERGETGVFDIEELVELLREDNAQDLVVIEIPPEAKYVQYMVIASSATQRHRNALSQLVRAAYKDKKNNRDHSLIIEGKGSEWVALDMGNIVLHIMKPETREMYDLETLWTVGAAFDEKAQVSEDELVGVRRPRDPLAPPATPTPVEAVT